MDQTDRNQGEALGVESAVHLVEPRISRPPFKLLMGRLRVGNVRQMAVVSTPEGFGLLWEFFVKEAAGKSDRRIIKARTQDNPFIAPDFIESLLENYPPQLIKAYLEGEFVSLTSGQIYTNFDRTLNHCTEEPHSGDRLHIGMDFNVGKMAAIIHVLRDGLPCAVDEVLGQQDTPAMIAALQSRFPRQWQQRLITAYSMNGSRGPWATYWIANGTTESGTNIDAGQRIALEVSQNGFPKSQLFDKRLVAQVLGVVRLSNGALSTADITTAQVDYSYGNPVYTLEQALLPGYAIALQVAPRFRQEELDGYLQASPVEIKPYFMPQAGSYVPGYRLWGDIIYSIGNRRRIFPKAGAVVRVGDGSGLVQRFEFEQLHRRQRPIYRPLLLLETSPSSLPSPSSPLPPPPHARRPVD